MNELYPSVFYYCTSCIPNSNIEYTIINYVKEIEETDRNSVTKRVILCPWRGVYRSEGLEGGLSLIHI